MSNKLKKDEGQEKILKAIQSGKLTPNEIKQELGWDRKKFWYHKRKCIEKGLIRERDRKLEIVLQPENIADEKKLAEIMAHVKSKSDVVREEAIIELEQFATKYAMINLEVYRFLLNALEKPEYKKSRDVIIRCLKFGLVNLSGTDVEKKVILELSSKPSILYEFGTDQEGGEFLRGYSLDILAKGNPDKYIKALLDILLGDEEIMEPGDRSTEFNRIGNALIYPIHEMPDQELEKLKKRCYGLLEEHQNDEKTVMKLKALLIQIRSRLYPHEPVDNETLKEFKF